MEFLSPDISGSVARRVARASIRLARVEQRAITSALPDEYGVVACPNRRDVCSARRGGHQVSPVAGAGPPHHADDDRRLRRGVEPLPSLLCLLWPRLPGGEQSHRGGVTRMHELVPSAVHRKDQSVSGRTDAEGRLSVSRNSAPT